MPCGAGAAGAAGGASLAWALARPGIEAMAKALAPSDSAASENRMGGGSRPNVPGRATAIEGKLLVTTAARRYCAWSVTVSITVSSAIDVDEALRPYEVRVSVVLVAVRNAYRPMYGEVLHAVPPPQKACCTPEL